MQRALRRAAWGVVAASALGAMPALALPPGPAEGSRPGQAPPGDDAAAAQLRFQAVHVELAWLAEPLTFGYQLVAHPAAGALEVCGHVPSATVRQRVLDVARANTTFPVVDRLQTHADLAQRTGGAFAEALRDEAAALLAEAFPEDSGGFVVGAGDDGRITVSGTVASLEEKLAVSRRLRWLSGCTCVVNCLEVGRVTRRALVMPPGTPMPVSPVARTGDAVPAPAGTAPAGGGVQQTSWQVPGEADGAPKPVPTTQWAPAAQAPPPPAPPSAAPPSPAAGAVQSGAPYVSTGTVVVSRPPSAAASLVPVAALKRHIEAVCGRAAHGVEVVPVSDSEVQVRLRVASISDGGRLSTLIIGIPELAKYRVSFQVRVDP